MPSRNFTLRAIFFLLTSLLQLPHDSFAAPGNKPKNTSVPRSKASDYFGLSETPADAEKIVPTPSGVPVVMTPFHDPDTSHGETLLIAVAFERVVVGNGGSDAETSGVRIQFRAERVAEVKRDSPTVYNVVFKMARVGSPLFLAPQVAPEDYSPFKQVLITEQSVAGGPITLTARIELSTPALLDIKSRGKEVYIIPKAEPKR